MNHLTKFIKCAALLAAGMLAVQDSTGEISVTASREYVDRKVGPKRDKDDYKIYRKVKDCWTWTNWASPDATASAPADFLAAVNDPTSEPVYFANGTWCGVNQFWPNGNIKYMKDIGPYGTGSELSLNWSFKAYAEDGTTELFRFGATSVRTNATDDTLICWDSVNQSIRLVTNEQISRSLVKVDGTARTLPRYLWLYETDDPYLDDAKAWYTNYDHIVSVGCSAIRKGDLIGHNFDSSYDDRAEFIVKVPAAENRRASVGVSNLGTNLTEKLVVSGSPSPLYKVLPGVIVDGINDAGVVAEINVIPRDHTKDPKQSEIRQLSSFAVVRYVLDNFTNAQSAARYVAAHYYIPEGSKNSYHWMIADKDATCIVEDGKVVMLWPADGDCALVSHRVFTERGYDPTAGYTSDPYGSGSERYAALLSAPSVLEGLVSVRYTHVYASGWPWPDEFAGESDAQGPIPHDKIARLLVYANDKVAPKLDTTTRKPKARGNGCWQTLHSSIYDITNKTLRISVQETDDWFVFHLPASGTVKSVNGKTDKVELDAADVGALPANPDWYEIYGDANSFSFDAWTKDESAIGFYAGGGDSYFGIYNGTSTNGVELHADHLSVMTPEDTIDLKYPDEGGTLATEEKIRPIVSHVANTNNPHAVTAEQIDAVPLVEDEKGNKTAVTIGSRASGAPVGEGSLANGDMVIASGPGSHAGGINTVAIGKYSHAYGVDTFTKADYSYAGGVHAGTKIGDDYAYAWNGDQEIDYVSHDPGTFNINPAGGLDGFYIGEQTLYAILTNKADKAAPSAANNLASLTADGNLADSGKTVDDFLPRVSNGPVYSTFDINGPLFMDMDGYIQLRNSGFIYGSFDNIREEGGSPISLRTELDSKANLSMISAANTTFSSAVNAIVDIKADKATTLEGYGITNAATKAEVAKKADASAISKLWKADTNGYLTAEGEYFRRDVEDYFTASVPDDPETFDLVWEDARNGFYSSPFFSDKPSTYGFLTYSKEHARWELDVGGISTYTQSGTWDDSTIKMSIFTLVRHKVSKDTYSKVDRFVWKNELYSKADLSMISATNTTFSNAVISVGLNIDTNSVAVLNKIAKNFGGFPLGAGEAATTVGGLLAALAAAVAWLKKNKVQALKLEDDSVKTSAENGVAKLDEFFTESTSYEGDLPEPTGKLKNTKLDQAVQIVLKEKGGGDDEKMRAVFSTFARMDDFTTVSDESDSFDIAITKLSQLLGEDVAA